jgi:transcriptional regulator with XRE-family HTH domain
MLYSSTWLKIMPLSIKKEILQKTFGQHIRKIRLQKGLTQLDVSSTMNKDQQSLQRVESGNVSPSLYYLFQLADGLGISIQELMTFEIITKKRK